MHDRVGALFFDTLIARAHVGDKVKRTSEELEFIGSDLDNLERILFGGNSGLEDEVFF